MTGKPEGMTEEHLEYLDELRESGVNMDGAFTYLEREFGLPAATARAYLSYWIRTFSEFVSALREANR